MASLDAEARPAARRLAYSKRKRGWRRRGRRGRGLGPAGPSGVGASGRVANHDAREGIGREGASRRLLATFRVRRAGRAAVGSRRSPPPRHRVGVVETTPSSSRLPDVLFFPFLRARFSSCSRPAASPRGACHVVGVVRVGSNVVPARFARPPSCPSRAGHLGHPRVSAVPTSRPPRFGGNDPAVAFLPDTKILRPFHFLSLLKHSASGSLACARDDLHRSGSASSTPWCRHPRRGRAFHGGGVGRAFLVPVGPRATRSSSTTRSRSPLPD